MKRPAQTLLAGLLLATSLQGFYASANPACIEVFVEDKVGAIEISPEQTTRLLEIAKLAAFDTTGLRAETKLAVPPQNVTGFLAHLRDEFGTQALIARETPRDGFSNITETLYPDSLRFVVDGKKKSAKIRVRRYLEENLDDGSRDRSAFTENTSFLELKIDHPEFDSVVLKPRLRLEDRDIKTLLLGSVTQVQVADIAARAAADPVNAAADQAGLTRPFLEYFMNLRASGNRVYDAKVQLSYKRDAYRLRLMTTDQKPVDVQMTFDEGVEMKDPSGKRTYSAYPQAVRVAEIKIPLEFSQLRPEDFKRVPGLEKLAQFVDLLRRERINPFEENRGKLSNSLRMWYEALD